MSDINIEKCLCFTANTNNSTISISIDGTPSSESNFLYSRGTNWISITPGSSTITLRQGDKVYLKGNNPSGISKTGAYYYFVMTGSISASGNIMSIIDNGRCTTTVIPGKECFFRMFKECTSLTTPPELPATTLKEYCYGYLFHNCSSLLVAPELPASISKSCYHGMFDGCTSLSMPPALPMTDLDSMCYNLMFLGCTSLIEAPSLPATTLASTCYKLMFYGCTSLTTPPELPATTLDSYCYWSMFYGCTSLTTAPELPATTLTTYCYRLMFLECSSLTTPPALPATTLAENCYDYMFNGCRSLVVSDSPGPAYNKAWTIPFLGTFTNTYSQAGMFTNCLRGSGRSSNDMPGEAGQSYTYYTQNFPNPTLIAFKPGNYHNYKTKNIGGLSSYQLTAEDLSSTPTPKTSPGYVFVDGWYNESSCTTKAVIGQEITGPTILYGKVLSKYLVDIRGEGDIQKNGIEQNARDYKLDTARKMLNDNIYIYAVTHNYDMGWDYHNKVGDKPTNLSITTPYTGQEITNGYNCPDHVTMVGNDRGIDHGTYIAIYTPDIGYVWSDGTIDSITVVLSIIPPNYLCFTANSDNSKVTIYLSLYYSTDPGRNFLYSYDRSNWTEYTIGTQLDLTHAGDKVYFKGNNPNGINTSEDCRYYFRFLGNVSASGNIMSIIDNGACSSRIIPCEYCFYKMFSYCSNLLSTPELPATELTTYCYGYMFYSCTSLTSISLELLATELKTGCYYSMFRGCTSLTTVVALPSTTLDQYSYGCMFMGCTSLIVSDTQTELAPYSWNIPAINTFSNTYLQNSMFKECAGSRSSNDMPGVAGNSYTYYTQNEPI